MKGIFRQVTTKLLLLLSACWCAHGQDRQRALYDHIQENIMRMRQIIENDSKSRFPENEKVRQLRYAFRTLNMPDSLHNTRLVLENHELENDIAQRQGKSKSITQGRIAIDRFMISQAEAANELTDRFAEIWGYTIDPER